MYLRRMSGSLWLSFGTAAERVPSKKPRGRLAWPAAPAIHGTPFHRTWSVCFWDVVRILGLMDPFGRGRGKRKMI